jgi:NAD(P)-dependent dehydrogenase (short-subunit alcohol dehydrogenase family)
MKIGPDTAVVITGGASGLGEATGRHLASLGAKVALFDLNRERGEALAAELGGVFCEVNVTDEAAVDAAFARARGAHGQERVLLNCAGVGSAVKTASRDRETGRAKHFPLDAFARVLDVNLVGAFRCLAKSAAGMLDLPPLEDGERGVIINTASIAAHDGQVGQAAYAASKGGIVSLTLPVARDLMNDGIRVNCILPGIFDTPLMAKAAQPVREALAASIPFPKRFGRPPEYARLAAAIIENPYLNAECIRLDGGVRMPPR